MKLALFIWPRDEAEWVELSLSSIPDTTVIFPEMPFDPAGCEMIVVDGDSPGPVFMGARESIFRLNPLPMIIGLGSPESAAFRLIEWDNEHTFFIPKPYELEDLKQNIAAKLEDLKAPVIEPDEGPKKLGYLSTLSLPDLVQMLCLNLWSGRIEIRSLAHDQTGEIFIDNGEVIHATCGELVSETAVFELIRWNKSEFSFYEESSIPTKTIETNWQGLLLEGARLIDENSTPTTA